MSNYSYSFTTNMANAQALRAGQAIMIDMMSMNLPVSTINLAPCQATQVLRGNQQINWSAMNNSFSNSSSSSSSSSSSGGYYTYGYGR